MARSVALSVLRGRVRESGDFGPDTAATTARYPNARINKELNASWSRAREIINTEGDGQIYLKQGTGTMTAGAIANASFGTITAPTDLVAVHGIDVLRTATDIYALQAGSWGDRNTFRDIYGGAIGAPIAFCMMNMGVETTTTVSAATIAIFPAPDKAYSYSIWYLPKWTDLANDTDVFDGIAGHEDWAMWDTIIKITAGDNNAINTYQIAVAERQKAEDMITRRVNTLQRVGPTRRRDISGDSRRQRALLWRRP